MIRKLNSPLALTLLSLSLFLAVSLLSARLAAPAEALSPPPLAPAGQTDAPALCPLEPGAALGWGLGLIGSSVRLAYNSQANEFVAVGLRTLTGDYANQAVVAQRIGVDGQPLGPVRELTANSMYRSTSVITYNSSRNEYLVVEGMPGSAGHDPDFSISSLDYRILKADLSLGGDPVYPRIPLARVGYQPSVTYNPNADEYLVVWYDDMGFRPVGPTPTPAPAIPTATPDPTNPSVGYTPMPTLKGLYAQRVRSNGERIDLEGGLLVQALSSAPADITGTHVVYNPARREYLVLWAHSGQLYTRRLDPAGVPVGDVVRLTPDGARAERPLLAFNPTDQQFLAVWTEAGPSDTLTDVLALRLDGQGAPLGERFALRATSRYEAPVSVVYDAAWGEYLVAFTSDQPAGIKRGVQRVSAQGALLDEALAVEGDVVGLGAAADGAAVLLSGYGYRAQRLAAEPCGPAPTAPAVTPTPIPVTQRQATVAYIETAPWGARRLFFQAEGNRLTDVFVTHSTQVDERWGELAVGAAVWYTAYRLDDAWTVADRLVVLPANRAQTTPTPEVTPQPVITPTPTATATPSYCALARDTTILWPPGADMYEMSVVHNTQADEFVALAVQFVSEEAQTLIALRLSALGQVQEGRSIVITDRIDVRPVMVYASRSNSYLVVWGQRSPGQTAPRLMMQRFDAIFNSLGAATVLDAAGHWPRLAYNPDDDEFLALWSSERADPPAWATPLPQPTGAPTPTPMFNPRRVTWAMRVGGNGIPVGPAFSLVTTASPIDSPPPSVVYNTAEREYLLASGVALQRLSRTGAPLGDYVPRPEGFEVGPLVYNSQRNQYLLVGPQTIADPMIMGRLLDRHAQPVGTPFAMSDPDRGAIEPKVVYNAARDEYVAAGSDGLRFVSADGRLLDHTIDADRPVLGLGVNNSGHTLVLAGHGRLARVLDRVSRCGSGGTPVAAPTPFRLTDHFASVAGEIESITRRSDTEEWTVAGETVIVSWLTGFEGADIPVDVGTAVEVAGWWVPDRLLAGRVERRVTGNPVVRPYRLYLPLLRDDVQR